MSGRRRRVQRFTSSFPPPGLNQGAHIVVADEKPALLDMMVRTLRVADYCVFQAYDGQVVYELALALRKLDLLITNTKMPGMNGPALIRQVRSLLPALPILYISDKPSGSTAPQGLPADVPTLYEPFTAEKPLLPYLAAVVTRHDGSTLS